mgnify:CR=1 FL=1
MNKQPYEAILYNPWSYKPWWCQPWSIVLTGIAIISGSWLLIKTLWLTVIMAVPVLIWMGFFLLIWPQLMRRAMSLENDRKLDNPGKIESN